MTGTLLRAVRESTLRKECAHGEKKCEPPKEAIPGREENWSVCAGGAPQGIGLVRKGRVPNPGKWSPQRGFLSAWDSQEEVTTWRLTGSRAKPALRTECPEGPAPPHAPEPVESEEAWGSSPWHGGPGPRKEDIKDAAVTQAQATPASRAAGASGTGTEGPWARTSHSPWMDREGE